MTKDRQRLRRKVRRRRRQAEAGAASEVVLEILKLTNGEGETLQASIQQEQSLTSDNVLARDQRVIQLTEEACLGLGLRP